LAGVLALLGALGALAAGCGGHRQEAGAPRSPGVRAPGPTLAAVPVGAPRLLHADFLGFNGEAVTAPPGLWRGGAFLAAVARLHPQALRIFGGTTANFWDWRAGTFVSPAALAPRSPSVPPALAAARSKVSIQLADWARVARLAGATPVFDLNLVTSTLDRQVAMLRAASRLGLPIDRIELGNELYLPRYRDRFPSGRDYGAEATRWIAALKAAFPGAQVAAAGYTPTDVPGRRRDRRELSWNADMLSTLRGEDAITFHPYFASGLPLRRGPAGRHAVATALGAPTRALRSLRAWGLAALPPNVAAWVTEWNLFDRRAAVHGTWAQGLEVASFGLGLLGDPRVVAADEHALVASGPFGALFGDANGLGFGSPAGARVARAGGFYLPARHPPATRPLALSASGVAMKALLAFVRGAGRVQVLAFSGAPSASSVQGALIAGPRGRRALLVNLGAAPVRVRLAGALPAGTSESSGKAGRGGSFVELAADPSTPVAGEESLSRSSGRLSGGALVLAPYALAGVKL
jgi:hypothetical protein